MKQLFVLLFVVICFSFKPYFNQISITKKWVVKKEGKLLIDGKTNINTYACSTEKFTVSDTIFLKNTEDKLLANGKLVVKIETFNCFNSAITKEFRKTLKTQTYPTLTIKLLSFNKTVLQKNEHQHFEGLVEIQLAGTKKNCNIDYYISNKNENSFRLNGSKLLHFSDFKLKAPEKFGGLLKTKDELFIQFYLIIEEFE